MRARMLVDNHDTQAGSQELRVDPADGNEYSRASFVQQYGGTEEWEAAAASAAESQDSAPESASAEVEMSGGRTARQQRKRPPVDLYASELMVPEWMVSVPADLPTQWLVLPRPQGKRCLVVASRGATTSRARNGGTIERFQSHLPGGGRTHDQSNSFYTILDCVHHVADNTYYVLDCMCWNGHAMYDCAAEFRLFWLQSKLGECGAGAVAAGNKRRFSSLPCFPADPTGIMSAYSQHYGFTKDCLLFVNKETQYQPGVTSLAVLWKDGHCSEYFIESRSTVEQIATFVLGPTGELNTCDDPTYTVASLSPELLRSHTPALSPGDPVRCAIKDLVLSAEGE